MTLTEEQGGFDLERARAADEALPYPLDAKEIWVSGKGQMHIFHGQAAEIERLRAEHEAVLLRRNQIVNRQVARIKELEAEITELKADLEQSEIIIEARLDVIDQQAAQIRELEADVLQKSILCDSLVENCNSLRNRAWKAEARIEELDEDFKESWRKGARAMLKEAGQ